MSVAVTQHKNFVGGEWVESGGGETMEVLNPATGETIAHVPRSTADDADRAVQAAVGGLIGREAAGSLLELSLAADAPPTTGLVPGDCHVDEPLVEVALLGRRVHARIHVDDPA